ncbi:MAG: NAD(P)H-dependent oxidoreductase subunit E [candidate division WOR-3 bacterium]|nr:MAG: NAD(P)H-dependent oxidoreductase subunit E [candidate division WOR-3 bacterium]
MYDESPPEELHLESAEVAQIETILHDYRDKKGALMPVLQAINNAYNYFPGELLRYMARELKIPLSLIYNVATFYKAFSLKKRGKHVIRVCQGTACHVRGAKRVLEEFERILGIEAGNNTDDLLFTLETVNCVGACALAPVIMIGGEYFGQMTTGKVEAVVDRYYKEGNDNAG